MDRSIALTASPPFAAAPGMLEDALMHRSPRLLLTAVVTSTRCPGLTSRIQQALVLVCAAVACRCRSCVPHLRPSCARVLDPKPVVTLRDIRFRTGPHMGTLTTHGAGSHYAQSQSQSTPPQHAPQALRNSAPPRHLGGTAPSTRPRRLASRRRAVRGDGPPDVPLDPSEREEEHVEREGQREAPPVGTGGGER